jgi:group I intron endonuclease
MMQYGTIYQIINKTNGKEYIGQTICTLNKRFGQHMSVCGKSDKKSVKLYNAVKKYGKECFKIEPIFVAFDREGLDAAEIAFNKIIHGTRNSYFGWKFKKHEGNQ